MKISVEKVICSGALGKCEVVSGKSYLDNPIEYIEVLESPSGYKWLQPNVIVLSTIYPLRNNQKEQSLLIKRLSEVGTAAIAIKPERFIPEIPNFMLEDSERYGIPVIKLPFEVSFGKAISMVSNLLLDNNTEILLQTLENGQAFLELLQAGANIDSIIKKLSDIAGCSILLEDKDFQLVMNAFSEQDTDIASILTENKKVKKSMLLDKAAIYSKQAVFYNPNKSRYSYLVAPLKYNSDLLGYITLIDEKAKKTILPRAIQKSMLISAANTVALGMAMDRMQKEQRKEKMHSILNLLLNGGQGGEQLASVWLDELSVEKDSRYVVIRLSAEREQSEQKNVQINANHILAGIIERTFEKEYILPKEYEFILIHKLINETVFRQEVEQRCKEVEKEIAPFDPEIRILAEIGGACDNVLRVADSYQQALAVHQLRGKGRFLNQVLFYDDVNIYSFFLQYKNKKRLQEYVDKYLKSILTVEDMKFGVLDTLEVYLSCGRSMEETARKMGLHVNTMKYRIKKIKDLLPGTLDDPEYAFNLQLAITIYHTL